MISRTLVILTLLFLSACSTFFKAQNQSHQAKKVASPYNAVTFDREHDLEENLIILAFSGGGTRAAALSYGVLQELNQTQYPNQQGQPHSVLADVDFISAVSGGSFTAAYYGAFGQKIFRDYEDTFLRRSNESALISKMLNPGYWIKSLTSGFDRTELAVEYYDNTVFKRKTFGDIPLDRRPFVVINATDLSLGQRFPFVQDSFDLICSDLSNFPLARAVTASSAVPILFPSIVLKNYANTCPRAVALQPNSLPPSHYQNQKQKDYVKMLNAYRDAEKKQYLHLVDGGLSDNLGLRAISDHFDVFGIRTNIEHKPIKRVMIILVNSNVEPQREMDQLPASPSVSETLDAFTEALIQNRNSDTKGYFFDQHSDFEEHIRSMDSEIDIYVSEVTFTALKSEKQRLFFNKLPTSLELSNEQIDQVIEAGRVLLRNNTTFQAFLNDQSP